MIKFLPAVIRALEILLEKLGTHNVLGYSVKVRGLSRFRRTLFRKVERTTIHTLA